MKVLENFYKDLYENKITAPPDKTVKERQIAQ